MLVTYFGIILFPIVEWIVFIKTRSPVTQARSLQIYGREVAYNCLRQRHEILRERIFGKLYWRFVDKIIKPLRRICGMRVKNMRSATESWR